MDDVIDARECVFCGKWATEFDAIEFFLFRGGEQDVEYCDDEQCVCNDCVETHLDWNEMEEMYELLDSRTVPKCARPARNCAALNCAALNCDCDVDSEDEPSIVTVISCSNDSSEIVTDFQI